MNRHQTLQDLEGDDWGEPTYDSSLVRTIHALRRRPLSEFTVENLRIMIGQQVGVEHLMPLALDELERDPFVSGDFYPGDLLNVVMSVNARYWVRRPAEAVRMTGIAGVANAQLNARSETDEIKARLRVLMAAEAWVKGRDKP